jgi:hypothetical protein
MQRPHLAVFKSCADLAYEDKTARWYKCFIDMTKLVKVSNVEEIERFLDSSLETIIPLRVHYDNPEMAGDKDILAAVFIEHIWSFYVIYTEMSDTLIEAYDTFNTKFRLEINKDDSIFDTNYYDDEITRASLLLWEEDYKNKIEEIKAAKRRL